MQHITLVSIATGVGDDVVPVTAVPRVPIRAGSTINGVDAVPTFEVVVACSAV